jgi:hypothetical protein
VTRWLKGDPDFSRFCNFPFARADCDMSQTREFHTASAQGLAGGSQFVYCGASIDALLAQNAHVVISPSSFLVQYWVNCLLLYLRQPEEEATAGGLQ